MFEKQKTYQNSLKNDFLKNKVHFSKMNLKFCPPRPPELLFNHRPHLFSTGPSPQMPTNVKNILGTFVGSAKRVFFRTAF